MSRLASALLCAVFALASACHKNVTEEPEPTGPLEGTWIVGLIDPVQYDSQNNVLATYTPVAGILNFTQLTFTSSTIQQYDTRTNFRDTIAYARTGYELTCPPPADSYTIRKLTAQHLDLYRRGQYSSPGPNGFRTDFTIHLQRQ